MKKKMMRLLAASLVCVFLATGTIGCNETVAGEEVVSNEKESISEEILSEEDESEEASLNSTSEKEVSEEASEEESSEEETSSDTSSEESEEASEEKPSEEPSEEKSEEPAYTVEDMDATKYAQRSVNVRKGPSTDYEKIGGLKQNDEVHVTGKASTGWYRIDYNGTVGFVANSYLGNEKVVAPPSTEKPPVETTPEQPPSEQSPSEQPPSQEKYQVRVDYDMLALINQERAACGASQLVWNSDNEAAAMARIKAIAESGQLSHDNPLPGTRGEIMLKRKSGDLSDMVEQYKGSPGHYGVMSTDGFSSMVSVSCGVWSELGQRINMYYNVVIFF